MELRGPGPASVLRDGTGAEPASRAGLLPAPAEPHAQLDQALAGGGAAMGLPEAPVEAGLPARLLAA